MFPVMAGIYFFLAGRIPAEGFPAGFCVVSVLQAAECYLT